LLIYGVLYFGCTLDRTRGSFLSRDIAKMSWKPAR
jgi:hypothetical protein